MNPFAVIGLGIDVVGMALIVAGALVPGEARWPLIITGAALSFVGVIVFLIGNKVGRFYGVAPRLAGSGVPATALVEQVRDTGVIFNNAPVLGFRLKVTHDARDYPAEVQQAVPRHLLGAVLPGARLAVRVDPADPARVAVDWSQAPTPPREAPAPAAPEPGGSELVAEIPPERRMSAAELLARGRRGTARIVAAREMGDAVRLGVIAPGDERAGAKMALLDLEVKLPGREPYPVRVVHWVPASLAGQVSPGREVVVAVDRDDPEHQVAIDWETPTA
jgi:hypothetical protein